MNNEKKTIYLIGGTMGIGKTTICQELKHMKMNSVFLDGDWCWDANPFVVNEETKTMVMQNISYLLNQFIHCSTYEAIIFCWVMHEQDIIDTILKNIDTENCEVKTISLICNEDTLRQRINKDITKGIRTKEVLEKSIARLPLYQKLNTKKIETDDKSVEEIAVEIANS